MGIDPGPETSGWLRGMRHADPGKEFSGYRLHPDDTFNCSPLRGVLFVTTILGLLLSAVPTNEKGFRRNRPPMLKTKPRLGKARAKKLIYPPIMNPELYPDIMGRDLTESGDENSIKPKIDNGNPHLNYAPKFKQGPHGGHIGLVLREAIVKRRINMQMTQRDLAEVMGVSPAVVAGWESGTVEPDHMTFREFQLALKTKLPKPEYPDEILENQSWDESDEGERKDDKVKSEDGGEDKQAEAKDIAEEEEDITPVVHVRDRISEYYRTKKKRKSSFFGELEAGTKSTNATAKSISATDGMQTEADANKTVEIRYDSFNAVDQRRTNQVDQMEMQANIRVDQMRVFNELVNSRDKHNAPQEIKATDVFEEAGKVVAEEDRDW